METDPTPTPTVEPAPPRDGRDASSRMRVLAASAAVAALTGAVGLNAIVLTQAPPAATTGGAAGLDGSASSAPSSASGTGDAGATPASTDPAQLIPRASAAPVLGGQPPQRGQGPGHATSGGS